MSGRTPTVEARPARASLYAASIREDLDALGFVGLFDVRHIEAFMRLEHSTLDGLSAAQFRSEVRIAALCVEAAGPDESEALAESFGMGDGTGGGR